MARIKKNRFHGQMGGVVFRELRNEQISQAKADNLQQTEATKASSSEFKQCSSWAKRLRLEMGPLLADHADTYMYQRLTGQFYAAVQENVHLPKGERTPFNASMKGLEGFEFNSHSLFSDYFAPEITAVLDAQRQVRLTIAAVDPYRQMQFPGNITHAELVVLVHATAFRLGTAMVDEFLTLPLERYGAPTPETVWTSPPIPEQYLVVVTAKLLYYTDNPYMGKTCTNSKTMSPARVVFCAGGGAPL